MLRASVELRRAIVRYARALHARGWVANHDGNLTARIADNRFLATPTATSKADVAEGNLLEVDAAGTRLAGTSRPFSEAGLHQVVYRGRDDVRAVIHAHPPHATAIAASGSNPIERPFLPEAVVSIGPRIPLVPFAPPGRAAEEALAPHVAGVDAVLLENHGVLAWGCDLEQAFLRVELVEHLARVALLALPLGGVRPLPDDAIPRLLESRARAATSLGAAARANDDTASAPDAPDTPDIARIVHEELVRALRKP